MLALMNWATSFLHSLLAFVIILVPLVVFHEFGHFVFAKIFGVKAEIFSVGFGPRLWSRQMGETEFRLSAIPMGGYVKLLGEDQEGEISEADLKRALHKQAPWKRFFIFFGGPLFNFILATFIFAVILVIGEPQMASVVGRVVHGSVAEKAGFQSGDAILSVEGKPVKKFDELMLILNESPGKDVSFTVQHAQSNQPVNLHALATSQAGYSIYGEVTRVGEIEGLSPFARATTVGISNPASFAGKAGFETSDKILEVNQIPVKTWEEIESIYQKVKIGSPLAVKFEKSKTNEAKTAILTKIASSDGLSQSLGDALGLYSSELFVDKTIAGSPAEKAGLKAGDRLVSIGNEVVQSFFQLKDAVQKSGESTGKVQLSWERMGHIFSVSVNPTSTAGRDPVMNKTVQYTVGVMPMLVMTEPATIIERVWNPFKLVYMASERMVVFSWRNLISLKKMVTGDVSVGSLGGPIMMGKMAGESLTRGLIAFLTNMAIFSIGLGVLNILPVPVLDGGHLLLLGVESIRGKPLSMRQMEIVQSVGLFFILALMGVAFRNDIFHLIYS